jgi:hypothetical protein
MVIVPRLGLGSVVSVVMMMRGRIHRHLRRLLFVNAQLLLMTHTGWRAKHCRRHRTADGKQDGQQYQEPGAKCFHRSQVSTVT